MLREKKNPPAGNQGTPTIQSDESNSILPDVAALVDHVHVVLATIAKADGATHYRRHVYWNLPAAQRAVDRASMAGKSAELVLCQLVPVKGGAL
jgi:hypothetical protein